METLKKILSICVVLSVTMFIVGCKGEGNDDQETDADSFIVNQEAPRKNCTGTTIAPPLMVERKTGKPVTKELMFTKGDFDICIFIEVVGVKAPGSALVFIDDVAVARTSDFNANFKSLIRRVFNEEIGPGEHTLSVKLAGKPTSALKIKVTTDQQLSQQEGKDIYGKEAIYAYSLRERLLREEERPLNFQLSPKNWLTPGELYELMQKAPEGTEVIKLHLLVGNKDGVGFMTTPIEIRQHQDIENLHVILTQKYEYCLDLGAHGCSEILENALREDINSGKVLIGSFRAFGTPRNMYRFWEENSESIRFIQTIAHPIENAQTSFNPDDEVK